MNEIKVFPIGKLENDEVGFRITLDPIYKDNDFNYAILSIDTIYSYIYT